MKDHMDIGLPEKLELHEHPDYIHITRKWFGSQIVFLTAFAILWNVFLVNFYAGMDENTDILTMLFPLFHVVAGVCITYYVIAGWLNKSNIFLSKHTIEINHKPIPWFGNAKFKSTDLKQLYAKEKITNNRNGTKTTYEVHAILKNKKNIKLLSGLESSEQALFIEQEIENFLQIENTPVRGEVGQTMKMYPIQMAAANTPINALTPFAGSQTRGAAAPLCFTCLRP